MNVLILIFICILQGISPGAGLSEFADDDPLILSSIEPATVEAFGPFTLLLYGNGFTEDTVVMIQTTRGNRFIKYEPDEIAPGQLRLEIKTGFGLRPDQREIFVRNGKGSSEKLILQIVPKGSLVEKETKQDDKLLESMTVDEPPVLTELQPSSIPVAQTIELLIIGERFQPGAKAMILANVHVGTARDPEYELVEFEADFLAETMLLITFDRGFAPLPAQRQIFIRNPDGGSSNPLILKVLSQMEQ